MPLPQDHIDDEGHSGIRLARLIVADPGLINLSGHHFGYSDAVAHAAMRRGMDAIVLASQRLKIGHAGGATCIPCFRAHYQSTARSSRLRRAAYRSTSYLPAGLVSLVADSLRAARRITHRSFAAEDPFADELATALAPLTGDGSDLVLLHSVSAGNLYGLLRTRLPQSVAAVAVVLRRPPEDMDAVDAAPMPVASILRQLRVHLAERLLLFADTEALAAVYHNLLSAPVEPVPLPIVVPPVREVPPGDTPSLVFAGGARLEKGYTLLPPLVSCLRGRARFTIHSGTIDAETDPAVQRAHRQLGALAGADVTLVQHPLDPEAYMQLLASADLLLLPYDGETYGARSSGILGEARALGVPAIVPGGGWMQEHAGPSRLVVFKDADDFIPAVERTLRSLGPITAAFRAAAPAWRQAHNPDSLLDALLRPLSSETGPRPLCRRKASL